MITYKNNSFEVQSEYLKAPSVNHTAENRSACTDKMIKLALLCSQTNRKMIAALVIYVLMTIGNSVSANNPACPSMKNEEDVSTGGY